MPGNPLVERILDSFGLTADQRCAASTRGRDIVVTAGAGSGKTRTLVARYLTLLAEGHSPRRVAAITFTKKAAREMRNRVRSAIVQQLALAETDDQRQLWRGLDAQMDSARIGTIHNLCEQILRTHPAEAGVDPRFSVLDEGLAAALRSQAVTDTLDWLVGEATYAPLLAGSTTNGLRRLLAFLLDHRLEAQDARSRPVDVHRMVVDELSRFVELPAVAEPLADLRALQASERLQADSGDKLGSALEDFLRCWQSVEEGLRYDDWLHAARHLVLARRAAAARGGSKTCQGRLSIDQFKEAYDLWLDPWLGGKNAKDLPPDEALEHLFLQTLPLVWQAFDHLLQTYQTALRQQQALDFDDLEAGAARLLDQPTIKHHWQGQVEALLVDEFQDTNARQRQIVLALCGDNPGRLFVVGDARQSIYRFRKADVTVFRDLQQTTQRQGGLVINLDLTYRAHAPLLQVTGHLLAKVMGDQPDPERPYYVPFTPLHSNHDLPETGVQAPYIEFVLGAGEDAETARPSAACALVQRLLELRQAGQIQRWDDVTILMRASTGFPHYEEALEDASIPFVTVAGQGFYNRPEIRDVLNMLRTLADPWDDLALAGLLRSPAFGLSDTAIYLLRWASGQKQPLWTALQGDLSALAESDQAYAHRAFDLLQKLRPSVDRIPVADLLKQLVDQVDYRAILAPAQDASGRLWRNLDKLLADAQASKLSNLRSFLEYIDTLRDVGAREGEAPADAEGSVRLMTIHKAKGLEFRVLVLADAARRNKNTSQAAYLLPTTGLAYKLDQYQAAPLLCRLAHLQDGMQAEAEEKRLLYVALTRAKEKLLISGHCTQTKAGDWKADGWLGELAQAGEIDLGAAIDSGQAIEVAAAGRHPLRAWALVSSSPAAPAAQPGLAAEWPTSTATPLYQSLKEPEASQPDLIDPEPGEMQYPWRATGDHLRPPAEALGSLVHDAIRRWSFPGDPALPTLLETAALEEGLASPAQRAEAIRLAIQLLQRLRQHPLWQEIDQAQARYHEVPYTHFSPNNHLDTGYIDLLYRHQDEWHIIDFKTDSLHSAAGRQAEVEHYRPQMHRYTQAVLNLLHEPARVHLCFLDDEGRVSLQEM